LPKDYDRNNPVKKSLSKQDFEAKEVSDPELKFDGLVGLEEWF